MTVVSAIGKRKIAIYGAGDHGMVVAEAAAASGFDVLGFIDDRTGVGTRIGPWAVLAHPDEADTLDAAVIVGIGDNAARWRCVNQLTAAGVEMISVIHPAAAVSPSAVIDAGVFISAGAVVNARAKLHRGVIVNSGAVIEHDVELESAVHAAPGSVLTGRVFAGMRTLIGAGATVLPGRVIGADAIVGAGAVVIHDVPAKAKVVGVPARRIEG